MDGIHPQVGALVRALDAAAPFDLLDVTAAWLAEQVGALESAVLLVDYAERVLEAIPGSVSAQEALAARVAGQPSRGERHGVLDSQAGLAYRTQRLVQLYPASNLGPAPMMMVYVPVSMRSDRLGVLRLALPGTRLPSLLEQTLTEVARVLAYVLTGARRYTDRFEVLRRAQPLGLAAEIQWELLPVLAYDLPAFSLAGALEPTYHIGGDTFDYAISARELTVTISDAVGHGLRAALLGSLTTTAMRNARRAGHQLPEQLTAANHALTDQFSDYFVTSLALRIDTTTGRGCALNAGHPPPLLLREGRTHVLRLAPDYPLGLFPDSRWHTHEVNLRPGDRLVLLTDGIYEAHHPFQPEFGLERVAELMLEHADLPPVEFVRRLTAEVLDYREGTLDDDATVVALDWRGDPSLTR